MQEFLQSLEISNIRVLALHKETEAPDSVWSTFGPVYERM